MMLKIGIIGYGYWGPNLVRNFYELSNCNVIAVSDLNPQRLVQAKSRYPTIKVTENYQDLVTDPDVDAIAISTPVNSHFELAMASLKARKHVLVEKPLTSNSEQSLQLIEEAKKRKLILMVDHTFVYTGAVRKIKDLLTQGDLGDIYYYDSIRTNLGKFQPDVNVIWDLAVHDLSILDYVLPLKPVAVSATGISHIQGEPENIAYITLFFDNSCIAHVHVNWLAPVKVRKILIGGSQKMVLFDDIEPSEKIKVYDKGLTLKENPENFYKMLVGYRSGDMYAPQFDGTEALYTEANHFLDCIQHGVKPITDGESGLRIVKILEAATKSVKNKGQLIQI
jgi:predicted dehydrogenase